MTAAHIMISLTHEGKSIKQIASGEFDNNLELVTVWTDYMVALNWIHKNNNNGADGPDRWITTYQGQKWIEKVMSPYLHDDA
jgi:hypothetical protein